MILAFTFGRSFKYLTPLNNDAYFGSYQDGYAGAGPVPPPVSDRYILGTSMIKRGNAILNQGTTPLLNKGLVQDQLNTISH